MRNLLLYFLLLLASVFVLMLAVRNLVLCARGIWRAAVKLHQRAVYNEVARVLGVPDEERR